jgi:hypothetical protein
LKVPNDLSVKAKATLIGALFLIVSRFTDYFLYANDDDD